MSGAEKVTNVVIAGLGGQGVVKASDVLAGAAFLAGLDVKKSEIHGMSQRGGSVTSDVRFGRAVRSPMVPPGEADFLVVLAPDQLNPNRHVLRDGGAVITADLVDEKTLPDKRSLNLAMLGALSVSLDIPEDAWRESIRSHLPEKFLDANLRAFDAGRAAARTLTDGQNR